MIVGMHEFESEGPVIIGTRKSVRKYTSGEVLYGGSARDLASSLVTMIKPVACQLAKSPASSSAVNGAVQKVSEYLCGSGPQPVLSNKGRSKLQALLTGGCNQTPIIVGKGVKHLL